MKRTTAIPHNHVVLIGSHAPASAATTFGTGFLVRVRKQLFVVTCRHVILEAGGRGLFAIPKVRKTRNPPGGYSVLQLSEPRFHPEDGACTYDLAVAEITNVSRAALEAQNIVPVEISDHSAFANVDEGTRLTALGYPAEYAKSILAANINEPFPPYEIEGSFRRIPTAAIQQRGFATPLCEWFFAQTSAQNMIGKGISGGVVHVATDRQLAGVVLATGDFQVTSPAAAVEVVRGFAFASSQRVAEILFK